jgi:hypothetical protein
MPDNLVAMPKMIGIAPKLVTTARMTVIEQVVFSPGDAKPTDFEPSFVRHLQHADEQAIERKIKVTNEWKPLELVWFNDKPELVGHLVLRNDEGRNLKVNQTAEQKAETAKKVIQVGLLGWDSAGEEFIKAFAQCLPGESGIRIDPMNLHLYRICCPSSQEVVKATLFLVPR